MMTNYKDSEKENIKIANQDYIEKLRKAIKDNKLEEFFQNFNYKPRYIEIINVAFCYDDGIDIINKLYDYIKINISPIKIPFFIQTLNQNSSFHEQILKDFDYFYDKMKKYQKKMTIDIGITNLIISILDIPMGDKIIIPRLKEIFKEINPREISTILQSIRKQIYFEKIIKENAPEWLKISKDETTLDILLWYLSYDQKNALTYIKNNFVNLLISVGSYYVGNFLKIILLYQELIPIVKSNMKYIIAYSDLNNIIFILYELDKKYQLGIENNNNFLKMIKDKAIIHLSVGAVVKSNKSDYVAEIIKKLMKQERTTKYKLLSSDTWSNIVFKIGSKVLKIGWIRNNPNMINHYRILEDDYYEEICDESETPVLYIEIQSFLSQRGITENDINNFYHDIEKSGLVYIDPRGKDKSNFGILPKSISKKINVPTSESFKKKSLVLIDRDCIWKKGDKNIKYLSRY